MLPSLARNSGRHALASSFCASRHPLPRKQNVPQTRSSTGISYLDTWMGNQKRRPLAPAAANPPASSSRSMVPNATNNVVLPVNGSAPTLKNAETKQSQSVSSYQLYNLRLNRHTEPRLIIEDYKRSLQTGGNNSITSTIPVVLDMSAFHPDGSPHYIPPPRGTLTKIVNEIESNESRSPSNITISIVGVTNLPPPERKGQLSPMFLEAQSINLPVLQSAINTSLSPITKNNTSISSPPLNRKKRGGVAPLLRPRRPVNANKTIDDETAGPDENKQPITKNTIHLADSTTHLESVESYPSTKVHKGSIRSGQLITSDYPNQSLVIIGSINPGGEVWSEGDVFVFGKLRGRVLAGLRSVGDTDQNEQIAERLQTSQNKGEPNLSKPRQSSRIYATSFDPELVCIGDTFTTIDDVSKLGLDGVGPAMATLDKKTRELNFERFYL